jgi:hypothetical protein
MGRRNEAEEARATEAVNQVAVELQNQTSDLLTFLASIDQQIATISDQLAELIEAVKAR